METQHQQGKPEAGGLLPHPAVAFVVDRNNLHNPDCSRMLVPAFAACGISAGLVAWDDPNVDWSLVRLAVVRATWDYHLRLDEFFAWATRAARLCPLWNPVEVIVWNARKTIHQGRPLLRLEFRTLICKLYIHKQLHSAGAIHEHPELKKLADSLTKQEGHAVLLPTLRQVRLEIKRYKAEAKRQAEHANTKPAAQQRQTQLHPPHESTSPYSYVLSVAGPAQICQVDE